MARSSHEMAKLRALDGNALEASIANSTARTSSPKSAKTKDSGRNKAKQMNGQPENNFCNAEKYKVGGETNAHSNPALYGTIE